MKNYPQSSSNQQSRKNKNNFTSPKNYIPENKQKKNEGKNVKEITKVKQKIGNNNNISEKINSTKNQGNRIASGKFDEPKKKINNNGKVTADKPKIPVDTNKKGIVDKTQKKGNNKIKIEIEIDETKKPNNNNNINIKIDKKKKQVNNNNIKVGIDGAKKQNNNFLKGIIDQAPKQGKNNVKVKLDISKKPGNNNLKGIINNKNINEINIKKAQKANKNNNSNKSDKKVDVPAHQEKKNNEKKGDNNNKIIENDEISDKDNIINGEITPRGLNNIGATCYMNSVLQCFYHVFDLSNELIKLKNIDERKMPMTSAYLEVITELTFSKEKSISPIKFKIMISNNELFEGIGANDAKSLTLYILETLNEEFNGNNLGINNEKLLNKIRNIKNKEMEKIVNNFNSQYNSIIADLFYGLKMTTYKCLTCNDSPADYQLFNIINLPIEQTFIEMKKEELKVDILECLKVEQKPKYFNGNNQLFCDKCNKMVDGESVNRIYMAPKIMILFLDRGFNNSFKCEVTFPETLNMKEFTDIDGGEYHLIGVIEHLGPSSNSGHFIATCKHFNGNWYLFSDSQIIPLQNYKKEGEPYLLFYRRD